MRRLAFALCMTLPAAARSVPPPIPGPFQAKSPRPFNVLVADGVK